MPKNVACYAVTMSDMTIARQAVAHRGRRLEYFTIAWNSLEGLIAVGAGMAAVSISLVGFGVDSFIEVSLRALDITKYPAPKNCKRVHIVFSLKSRITEPESTMHAGASATSALSSVTFMPGSLLHFWPCRQPL
jgi:hypothetical protein